MNDTILLDPIVLDPAGFDQSLAWDACAEHVHACGGLEYPDGEPSYRAAFGADPGVVSCPECRAYYWRWGRVQECRLCGFVYPTDWWPMFSWGTSASRSGAMRRSKFHRERLGHPYYRFGFENPPDGDAMEAVSRIDWRAVLEPWPVP